MGADAENDIHDSLRIWRPLGVISNSGGIQFGWYQDPVAGALPYQGQVSARVELLEKRVRIWGGALITISYHLPVHGRQGVLDQVLWTHLGAW